VENWTRISWLPTAPHWTILWKGTMCSAANRNIVWNGRSLRQ